ncbi:hypothetical protein MARPO_0006s0016, partial [Marchantia polymorpha]
IAPAVDVLYEWRVSVVQGEHKNHNVVGNFSAYPTAQKLNALQKASIHTLSKAEASPKVILASICQNDSSCVLISRDFYKAKATIHNEVLAGKTPIKMLLDELHTKNICHAHDRNNGGHVTRLFFALHQCVKFANEFSHMMHIYCTYKSNRFKMPIFHIVGMSSTNELYYVAIFFLSSEVKADYIWTLEQFAGIFAGEQRHGVIVTDRKLALMLAIRVTFPGVHNLLCLAHPEESSTKRVSMANFFVDWWLEKPYEIQLLILLDRILHATFVWLSQKQPLELVQDPIHIKQGHGHLKESLRKRIKANNSTRSDSSAFELVTLTHNPVQAHGSAQDS